jgi:hypothetical protein
MHLFDRVLNPKASDSTGLDVMGLAWCETSFNVCKFTPIYRARFTQYLQLGCKVKPAAPQCLSQRSSIVGLAL